MRDALENFLKRGQAAQHAVDVALGDRCQMCGAPTERHPNGGPVVCSTACFHERDRRRKAEDR
jgi:hypothetical protein